VEVAPASTVAELPAEPVAAVATPAAAAIEPVQPTEAPKPEPAKAVAPVIDTAASLEQAGLVMIETAVSKVQSSMPIEVPQQPLGRKPKVPMIVAEEPLQMVETRRD